jgi:Family of unknown function (DUF6166)
MEVQMGASSRKVYQGTRSGPYGTAIIVQVVDPLDGGEYPLPFVDKHQWERVHYGTEIPEATSAEQRTHEWGYEGTGPVATAASILADLLGAPQALSVVQAFKRDVVARLGGRGRGAFELREEEIRQWLAHPAVVALIAKADVKLLEDIAIREDLDEMPSRHTEPAPVYVYGCTGCPYKETEAEAVERGEAACPECGAPMVGLD